jgi:sugar lactone lactonase YvrE
MFPRPAVLVAAAFAAGVNAAALAPAAAALPAASFSPLRFAGPAKTPQSLVYVSEFSTSTIDVFAQKGNGQQKLGTITSGISFPSGLWVDGQRNLWVTNQSSANANGYILEFPPGASTPSQQIDQPAGYALPTEVWRHSDGTLWIIDVTTYGGGYVVEYVPGTQTWSIINDPNVLFETGITGDKKGDIYVSGLSGTGAEVDVLKKGTSEWVNTGISLPYESGELAIDAQGNLVVADPFEQTVQTFAPGKNKPIHTIKCPGGCTDIAFDSTGRRLWNVVSPNATTIQELTYPEGRLVDTIDVDQNSEPAGIAASPGLYP